MSHYRIVSEDGAVDVILTPPVAHMRVLARDLRRILQKTMRIYRGDGVTWNRIPEATFKARRGARKRKTMALNLESFRMPTSTGEMTVTRDGVTLDGRPTRLAGVTAHGNGEAALRFDHNLAVDLQVRDAILVLALLGDGGNEYAARSLCGVVLAADAAGVLVEALQTPRRPN